MKILIYKKVNFNNTAGAVVLQIVRKPHEPRCVLSNHFLGGWRHAEDTMVAALLTFNDKLLPYTELKKVKEVQPRIKVLMLYRVTQKNVT